MSEINSLLSVENLRVSFDTRDGATTAVDDISFCIKAGQTLGIVGESGSGKSVTCYAILGLLQQPPAKVEQGKALFAGIDLVASSEKVLRTIRGNRISMIFQDPMTSLNPYLTVGEQIIEPLMVHAGISRHDAKTKAISLLSEVGIENAAKRFNQYPYEYSGGMRQRAMIAMALITEPELLIADEPTSALDVSEQQQILELIKSLQQRLGIGLIIISHDLDVVRDIAQHVVVMKKGVAVEQGEVDQVLSSPAHPYTRELINAVPRGVKPEQYRFAQDSARGLLEVRHMSISFAGFNAVDDVSLRLRQGEILGIVGASGSGKSTLSRGIVRLEQLDCGEVLLEQVPLHALGKAALRSKRKDIQMIFQDPYASLNPRMTVHDALAEPIKLHGIARSQEGIRQQVVRLMEEVDLSAAWINKYPHEFSGGQRQRVAIARALAVEPKLIVADEPVSALDVTVQARVLDLLLQITKKRGLSLIFISHDLKVVNYMADRIITMRDGKIYEV